MFPFAYSFEYIFLRKKKKYLETENVFFIIIQVWYERGSWKKMETR